ncbi:MAG: hypothetical protein AAFN41_10305, partial [Planctomycetota bacterium]
AVIRVQHPHRVVLAGPVRWNSIAALDSFNPPADPYLVLTVHHYEPFAFTHQGATWVDPVPPVGVVWTGDLYGFADGWQDWSWGTQLAGTADGLAVSYAQGWAGLQFKSDRVLGDVTRLRIRTDRPMRLSIAVGSDAGEARFEVLPDAGAVEHVLDVPAGLPVDRVVLQNATPDAQPTFVVGSVELDRVGGETVSLVMSERQAIDAAMASAAAWAGDREMRVNLGEFGAFSTADMASRAVWTRAVRRAAESNGIGWTYWELAAGFGLYDPDADAWRAPLLDALVGE